LHAARFPPPAIGQQPGFTAFAVAPAIAAIAAAAGAKGTLEDPGDVRQLIACHLQDRSDLLKGGVLALMEN